MRNSLIGIRVRIIGEIYYFFSGDFDVKVGDYVIVEIAKDIVCGNVLITKKKE